jgi:CRP-like cAMP-binding protein
MDSKLILSNINQYVQLNKAEVGFLESVLIVRPYKLGEVIVKSGDTARYMMFVNAGYLMTYYTDKEGNDHVISFATAGWWCGDVYSLNNEPVTIYTTKALSDGELLLLPRLAHLQLFEKFPVFERYFRVFFHQSVLRNQWRLIENYSTAAEERYKSFVNRFVGIEQYVPQKHIASYLGITPEFLSKVRKKSLRAKS